MTLIKKTLTRKTTRTFIRDGKKVTQRKTYRKVTRTPKVEAQAEPQMANTNDVLAAALGGLTSVVLDLMTAVAALTDNAEGADAEGEATATEAPAAEAPAPAAEAPAPAAERQLLRRELVRRYQRADGKWMRVYKNVYRKARPAPVEMVRVLVNRELVRRYQRADGKWMRVFKKTYRTVPKSQTTRVLVNRELVRRYRRADGKMMRVFKNTFRRELAA